ncbi:PepSY-associated TM helix domain-containing protein [Nitrospirillum sp. BR 11828]|uniref:PepSY-associated TM helix domain-containing protein n=1 Tax=Nitrospirillum sp. BR 11828 TaxID=3104325 RepID=UPI002ACA414E|nr:PepSY-associated TM helix domain-containing protein [Nitrospirillum sp. BR 11828]MDZ5650330.1 PepSY-associated TM helix domain-containing protein [Nitrospirillum sp. BR 11828]
MMKTLRFLHLWVGLILGLPLLALGLSGTVLVLEPELRGLFTPSPAATADTGAAHSVAEVVAAAAAVAPPGAKPATYTAATEPGGTATVRFQAPRRGPNGDGGGRPAGEARGPSQNGPSQNGPAQGGPQRGPQGPGGGMPGISVHIDPVTLAVVRTPGLDATIGWFHRLHGNLLIQDRSGRDLVGYLGIVMSALGLTGLVLWWPRPGQWRQAFIVRKAAKGARFHRELHGAVGIWGLVVFLVVSVTGVAIAFPQTIAAGVGSLLPMAAQTQGFAVPKVTPQEGGEPAGVDEAVAIALAASPRPGLALRSASLPQSPDQAIRVVLAPPGGAMTSTVTLMVDPWARQVVEVRDPSAQPAGNKVTGWMRPLHEGEGLGSLYRVLVALSGLLPLLFAITGTSMWWIKRRNRKAGAARAAAILQSAAE